MSHRLLLSVLSLLLLLPACARNPVSGRPQFVLISAQTERQIGQQEAVRVRESLGHAEAPGLQAYVEEVGRRLVAHSPRQDVAYSFHVVDTPEPNAFALPGGPIFVSRGLLALLDSEDELACVLGHEIGHVAARHSVRRITVAAPFAIVGIPGAIVGQVNQTLGALIAAPAQVAGGLALAPYSRGQEREADRVGMDIAGAAGWNPESLASTLTTLEREDAARLGEPRSADFFDTHPTHPDRILGVGRHASAVARGPANPVAADREAFLGELEGLLLGPNPRHGVFDEGTFLHPELGFAVSFPPGWRTDNQPQMVLARDPAPDAHAFVILQRVGDDDGELRDDVGVGLDDGLRDRVEWTEVGGLPAGRLVATRSGQAYDVTWILLGERVFRIAGVSRAGDFERYRETFAATGRSFHPLGPQDRARIREGRLRLASARAGESLADLLARSGSDWEPGFAAIANHLDETAPLPGGRLIKLSVPRVHQPAR